MAVRPQNTESENNTNKTENHPFYRSIFQNIIHISKEKQKGMAQRGLAF